MAFVPSIQLNNGTEIPQLGLGVFQVPAARTAPVVRAAFDLGYRHIDTAQMYGNEEGVGRALAEPGAPPRAEGFITTKLDNARHGYDEAVRALEESLLRLGTDYVDLYLIHWPQPRRNQYVETWKGFEKVLADGRARAIGVSNFTIEHLERLAAESGTIPAVNQIELHPWLTQRELREYHREHGIVTEAYSPLAQGGELLQEPVITELARAHGRTPAQIVLRWHIQLGNVVFPKTTRPERMRENIDVFDFELSDDEMGMIDALDRGLRLNPDPRHFG